MSVRFAAVTDVHLLLWSLQKISQFRRFGSSEMPCARCLSYLLSQETRNLWQNETNSNSNHLNSASAALRKKNLTSYSILIVSTYIIRAGFCVWGNWQTTLYLQQEMENRFLRKAYTKGRVPSLQYSWVRRIMKTSHSARKKWQTNFEL